MPRTPGMTEGRGVVKEEKEKNKAAKQKIRQMAEEEIGDVQNITAKKGFMQ